MTSQKPNKYAKRFANMDSAGGNHKAQTTKGIIQEGRKSYKATVDEKLGTEHSKGANKYAKRFEPIKQELGGGKPKQPAPTQQKQQVKPAPKPKGRGR